MQRPAELKRLRDERGNVRVDIFAGREIAHSEVISLMEDLRAAGFTKIQFGVTPQSSSSAP